MPSHSSPFPKNVNLDFHFYSGISGRGYLGGACYNYSVIQALIAEYRVNDIMSSLVKFNLKIYQSLRCCLPVNEPEMLQGLFMFGILST